MPTLGVVYMPDGDRMYAAARGLGATVEVAHEKQGLRTDRNHWPPRMVGSRSHELMLRIRDALVVTDLAPSGSVGRWYSGKRAARWSTASATRCATNKNEAAL